MVCPLAIPIVEEVFTGFTAGTVAKFLGLEGRPDRKVQAMSIDAYFKSYHIIKQLTSSPERALNLLKSAPTGMKKEFRNWHYLCRARPACGAGLGDLCRLLRV